jgi:hypothetical protein
MPLAGGAMVSPAVSSSSSNGTRAQTVSSSAANVSRPNVQSSSVSSEANAPAAAPAMASLKFERLVVPRHTVPQDEIDSYDFLKSIERLYYRLAHELEELCKKRFNLYEKFWFLEQRKKDVDDVFARSSEAKCVDILRKYFTKQHVPNRIPETEEEKLLRQQQKDYVVGQVRTGCEFAKRRLDDIDHACAVFSTSVEAAFRQQREWLQEPSTFPELFAHVPRLRAQLTSRCDLMERDLCQNVEALLIKANAQLENSDTKRIQKQYAKKEKESQALAIRPQPAIQQLVDNAVGNAVGNAVVNAAELQAKLSALESQVNELRRLNGGKAADVAPSSSAAKSANPAQSGAKKGKGKGKGLAQNPSRKEAGKPSPGSKPNSNPQRQQQQNHPNSGRSGQAEMGGSSAKTGPSTNPVDRGKSRS